MTKSKLDQMTAKEFITFRVRHGMGQKEFAEFLGVTLQAVLLWESGARYISKPHVRLFRLIDKYPEMIEEFGK